MVPDKPPEPPESDDRTPERSTVPLVGFERPPEHIGPYRILEQIGEGGMGTVYLAEQEHPVRRRVAVKIIKLGMDTREVIARFEAERQALAMMNHPNIARVFDAGSTEQGRPYFVMEHVPGEPITRYCDRMRLTTRERLELFIPVCRGIHHAHQKAIIHRDVKPSNILVMVQDGKPVPKVIDFGVAKAIEHRLTERTMFTEQGRLIGTPGYMSPEQAEMTGLNVDTGTDVYSLGVLLYELLAGAPPFDAETLRSAGLDEIQRLIREVDPPKPSTRVSRLGEAASAVAEQRGLEPRGLERQLRGELDWIVMRAMEKDRNRRYTSAAELAGDVGRSLRHEPVLASPPSRWYRGRKFVRRHRVGVTAGAVVFLALVLGTVGTTVGLLRAQEARNEARREAETAKQVSDFLVGVFKVSDPSEALGNTITAREILDKGAAEIEEGLTDQPEVQATLMNTMGNVYRGLGLYDPAQALLEDALQVRKNTSGSENLIVAESLNDLARLLGDRGEYAAAEPLSRESLRIRQKLLGEEDPRIAESLNNLGILLRAQGDYENAEPVFRDALAMRRKLLGRHSDTGESLNNLANLLRDQGDLEGAEPLYREALTLWRDLFGEHPVVATSLANLSSLLMAMGKYEEAEPIIRDALAMDRKLHGEEHPNVASSLSTLTNLLKVKGDYDEAETVGREALAMRRKLLGEEHPAVATSMSNLANVLTAEGKLEEAEALCRGALTMRQEFLGPEHPRVAWSLKYLGDLLVAKGDYAAAESAYEETLAMRRKLLGEEHRHTAASFYDLSCVLVLEGKRDRALEYLREAVKRGYGDAESLRSDASLGALRDEPEFDAILAEAGKPGD